MKNLDGLAKMHKTRKMLMVDSLAREAYEEKKERAWKRFLAKATSHIDTPTIRKQAKKMFELNYPEYRCCPMIGSKLARCPACGTINTNVKK